MKYPLTPPLAEWREAATENTWPAFAVFPLLGRGILGEALKGFTN